MIQDHEVSQIGKADCRSGRRGGRGNSSDFDVLLDWHHSGVLGFEFTTFSASLVFTMSTCSRCEFSRRDCTWNKDLESQQYTLENCNTEDVSVVGRTSLLVRNSRKTRMQ